MLCSFSSINGLYYIFCVVLTSKKIPECNFLFIRISYLLYRKKFTEDVTDFSITSFHLSPSFVFSLLFSPRTCSLMVYPAGAIPLRSQPAWINPCFRDTLRHLSRMRTDIPQKISLIKGRGDTDLNMFTAGGSLQTRPPRSCSSALG